MQTFLTKAHQGISMNGLGSYLADGTRVWHWAIPTPWLDFLIIKGITEG
jgi:hypothetical protein